MDRINIIGQIQGIQLSLSQSQYKILMSVMEENFSEKLTYGTMPIIKRDSKETDYVTIPKSTQQAGIITFVDIMIDGSAIIYEITSEGYEEVFVCCHNECFRKRGNSIVKFSLMGMSITVQMNSADIEMYCKIKSLDLLDTFSKNCFKVKYVYIFRAYRM